jgi:hypothetical protein
VEHMLTHRENPCHDHVITTPLTVCWISREVAKEFVVAYVAVGVIIIDPYLACSDTGRV